MRILFSPITRDRGLSVGVVVFIFCIFITALLMKADRFLRHRKGIPWASKIYITLAWLAVAAFIGAIWWIAETK